MSDEMKLGANSSSGVTQRPTIQWDKGDDNFRQEKPGWVQGDRYMNKILTGTGPNHIFIFWGTTLE